MPNLRRKTAQFGSTTLATAQDAVTVKGAEQVFFRLFWFPCGAAAVARRLTFYREAFDMEFSVKLAKLPEAFRLPERLRDRVSYDADRGRLSYRGFMTKCTYDE